MSKRSTGRHEIGRSGPEHLPSIHIDPGYADEVARLRLVDAESESGRSPSVDSVRPAEDDEPYVRELGHDRITYNTHEMHPDPEVRRAAGALGDFISVSSDPERRKVAGGGNESLLDKVTADWAIAENDRRTRADLPPTDTAARIGYSRDLRTRADRKLWDPTTLGAELAEFSPVFSDADRRILNQERARGGRDKIPDRVLEGMREGDTFRLLKGLRDAERALGVERADADTYDWLLYPEERVGVSPDGEITTEVASLSDEGVARLYASYFDAYSGRPDGSDASSDERQMLEKLRDVPREQLKRVDAGAHDWLYPPADAESSESAPQELEPSGYSDDDVSTMILRMNKLASEHPATPSVMGDEEQRLFDTLHNDDILDEGQFARVWLKLLEEGQV